MGRGGNGFDIGGMMGGMQGFGNGSGIASPGSVRAAAFTEAGGRSSSYGSFGGGGSYEVAAGGFFSDAQGGYA